jgi:hypothetical protein
MGIEIRKYLSREEKQTQGLTEGKPDKKLPINKVMPIIVGIACGMSY